jgi:hypothetical protein
MGKHYVPQSHLRRFQIEHKPGMIWMYDKLENTFKELPIKIVAQDRDFYPDDVEAELAQNIEGPGNAIIDKILRKEWLTDEERVHFSVYLMTMVSRGPRARRQNVERYPEIAREVLDELETKIQHWIETKQPNEELVSKRLCEVETAKEKYAANMPEQVLTQIKRPFVSPKTVACIYRMKWHIATAPEGMTLVTCDTPAHYFEGLGLSSANSEFTLPLSKSVALVGNNRGDRGIDYRNLRPYAAREINKRILSHVERFVFSPFEEGWIKVLANDSYPYLSSMLW